MLRKILFAALALLIGVMLIIFGGQECMVYLKKTTVPLNTSSIGDFNKIAMTEGEIASVIGNFATMTNEEKLLGLIPISKSDTDYYLVESYSREDIVRIENGEEPLTDGFAYIVAASKDETKAALNANLEAWIQYDEGKRDTIPDSVHFEGKIRKQPNGKDYVKLRDDFAAECGLPSNVIAEYHAIDSKIGFDGFAVMIIGIVCVLIGLIDGILIIRKFIHRND